MTKPSQTLLVRGVCILQEQISLLQRKIARDGAEKDEVNHAHAL